MMKQYNSASDLKARASKQTEGEEHLEPIYHTKRWKKIKNVTNEQIIKAWEFDIKINKKKTKNSIVCKIKKILRPFPLTKKNQNKEIPKTEIFYGLQKPKKF